MATYILRDTFAVPAANPLTTPRVVTGGQWAIVDTENTFSVAGGRLRGGAQDVSPVWGDARLGLTTAISRVTGRTFAALVTLEDFDGDLTVGWDTASGGTADPRAVGYSILAEDGEFKVVTPGAKISVIGPSYSGVRSMQYLMVVTLNDQGAYYFLSTFANDLAPPSHGSDDVIGIPAYPSARLLWFTDKGTAPVLYPAINSFDSGNGTPKYPGGHAWEDVRVLDLPAPWATNDGLATFADRVVRANSTTVPGAGYTTDVGVWGVNTNQIYCATPTAGIRNIVHANAGTSDGFYVYHVTTPTTGAMWFGCVLRWTSTKDYIAFTNNDSTTACRLEVFSGGDNPSAVIAGVGATWAANTTYRITIQAYGNLYRVWQDDTLLIGWSADTGNNNLAATGVGFYVFGDTQPTLHRFGAVAVLPHILTLHADLTDGAVPNTAAGTTVLADDVFTGTNGTALAAHTPGSGGAWTTHVGTQTIQTNKLAGVPGVYSSSTQNLGALDGEASVTLTTKTGLVDADDIGAGILSRYTDENNFLNAQILQTPAQPNSHEVELHELVGGVGRVVHKVQLGDTYLGATSYVLTVRVRGDRVDVLLDGRPRISYVTAQLAGTRWGLQFQAQDDGSVLDGWSVKALTGTIPPVISAVTSSGVTSAAATITWTTDQLADTQIQYGLTTGYGSTTALINTSPLVASHSQGLSGLAANTLYHYRVLSRNAGGALATGADGTFTTLSASGSAPVISGIGSIAVTSTSFTAVWTTDIASDTQVEYGTTVAYGSSTTLNVTPVTSHSVTVPGLTPNTLYHWRARSFA